MAIFALTALSILLSAASLSERQVIPLRTNASAHEEPEQQELVFFERPLPGALAMQMVRNVTQPTLTVYPAEKGPRKADDAVIVCPGGAGVLLDWQNEGTHVAEWLSKHGVNAFVLKYRLVPTPGPQADFEQFVRDHTTDSRQTALEWGAADAAQAMKFVRRRAAEWGVSPNRIGLMGFSMGAFIALHVVMNHDPDSRPNFAAAIYGGETAGRPIPADAPPLFAVVAQDDSRMAQPVLQLYSQWTAAKLPAELHIFAQGGHGFGTLEQGLPVDGWLKLFAGWLDSPGLFANSPTRAAR